MLIWDTGEYEVLPWRRRVREEETDDDDDSDSQEEKEDASTDEETYRSMSGCDKLRQAFQNHRIRLRLHGHRLPKGYTISLRLAPSKSQHANHSGQPPARKRRRLNPQLNGNGKPKFESTEMTPSPSPPPSSPLNVNSHQLKAKASTTSHISRATAITSRATIAAEEEEEEEEEEEAQVHARAHEEDTRQTHETNAYPGAINTVGSIYQRHWFLSLDRTASGFVAVPEKANHGTGKKRTTVWVRKRRKKRKKTQEPEAEARQTEVEELMGFDDFIVGGPAVERSVVTGRLAADVLRDEGVDGFVGRGGWRAMFS